MAAPSLDRPNLTLDDALGEAEDAYRAANPESGRHHARAMQAMPGGNTRTVLHYDPFPLAFPRAEGARLTDADGHELADFMGEYTAALYGHSDPVITAAIREALAAGVVRGGANEIEADFAAEIVARFPAIERVRFCNSGTEANTFALAAARAWTGREAVIVMEGGYHGGVLFFKGACPLNLPMPFHRVTYNDAEGAAAAIRALGEGLAAVILEPMLGGGGCIPATATFLETLRRETEAVGALLIFDEVMTSRLGPGGLHEAHGITPDLVTLGKYVGGGMSFGAFGGRAEIMARFDPREPDHWPHAGTFNNNVLTMAAGRAGLTRVYPRAAVAPFNALGERLRARLDAAIARADLPMQVTGMGTMMAVHFGRAPIRHPGAAAPVPAALRALIHLDLIARGFYTARRGMITLSLPLTEADCAGFAEAFEAVIRLRAGLIRRAVAG